MTFCTRTEYDRSTYCRKPSQHRRAAHRESPSACPLVRLDVASSPLLPIRHMGLEGRCGMTEPTADPEHRRADYCVMCGKIYDGLNGLDVCRKSECGCTHLWAPVGMVKDWFTVKRVWGPQGGIRAA